MLARSRTTPVQDFLEAKMGTILVAQVRELRRKAALCRRAASIPTSGSRNADRILLGLAERLEHAAARKEQNLKEDAQDPLLDTGPTAVSPEVEVHPAGYRSYIGW